MKNNTLKEIAFAFNAARELPEQIIGNGITVGVPDREYHALPWKFVSKHDLDAFAHCPAVYKAEKEREIVAESTPSLVFGSAFHARVLEPETFDSRFAVAPSGIDRRTKAGKEDYAAFIEANEGKDILTEEQAKLIETMKGSFESVVSGIWGNGIAEAVLVGDAIEREKFSVFPRGKADYICEYSCGAFAIFDVKTTTDASPEAFRRDCANFRYDVQAAYYTALFKQAYARATGGNKPKEVSFFFVCVEKGGICPAAIYDLGPEFLYIGEKTARKNLSALISAYEENVFPNYNDGLVATIEPPAWLAAQRGI